MFSDNPVAFTVKTPSPGLASVRLVVFAPPICGFALSAVFAYTTPRAVMVEPPSAVTLPPSVAEFAVMLADVGVVTVGFAATVTVVLVLVPVPLSLSVMEMVTVFAPAVV